MIGVMVPPGGIAAPAGAQPAAPPAAAPQPQPQSTQAAAPGAAPAKVANANRTMIGVMLPPGAIATPAAAPPPSAPLSQQPSSATGPAKVANANQTMVGVTVQPPVVQQSAPPAAPAAAPQPAMQPPSAPSAPSAAQPAAKPPVAAASPNDPNLYKPNASPRSQTVPLAYAVPTYDEPVSIPGLPSKRKTKSSVGPILGLVVAAALVGGGVMLALNLRNRQKGGALAAQLEAGPDGARVLAVRVPEAPAGATLRHESRDVPIENGVARLPGTVVGDRVGRVELPVAIVSNGTATPRTAQLVIGYLVRPELDGLGQNPPAARLAFRVQPGSRLELDGQPVQTDAQGHGVAAINDLRALPQGEALLSHAFSIRVQNPDNTRVEGTYRFELARTPLVIDRPARASLATSAERAVIRVRAQGATAVVVDGQPATRDGEVYNAVVTVTPGAARAVEIRAFRPQFAPALASVELERLTNDAQGITRFRATDASICADGTDGARLTVRGRVLAAPRAYNGGTTFQLLAQDRRCPGGTTALWIDAEPDVTAREGDTLRIVGTLTGTRTAVTTTGERRTDKVLHASFVRPAER